MTSARLARGGGGSRAESVGNLVREGTVERQIEHYVCFEHLTAGASKWPPHSPLFTLAHPWRARHRVRGARQSSEASKWPPHSPLQLVPVVRRSHSRRASLRSSQAM